jgi:hypothetical protein
VMAGWSKKRTIALRLSTAGSGGDGISAAWRNFPRKPSPRRKLAEIVAELGEQTINGGR